MNFIRSRSQLFLVATVCWIIGFGLHGVGVLIDSKVTHQVLWKMSPFLQALELAGLAVFAIVAVSERWVATILAIASLFLGTALHAWIYVNVKLDVRPSESVISVALAVVVVGLVISLILQILNFMGSKATGQGEAR